MYRSFADWDGQDRRNSWLAHYGVPGMKWGGHKKVAAAYLNPSDRYTHVGRQQIERRVSAQTRQYNAAGGGSLQYKNPVAAMMGGGGGGMPQQEEPDEKAKKKKKAQQRVAAIMKGMGTTRMPIVRR